MAEGKTPAAAGDGFGPFHFARFLFNFELPFCLAPAGDPLP